MQRSAGSCSLNRGALSLLIGLCGAALILRAAGCDLFKPRESDIPGEEGASWSFPAEPDSVLFNLVAAYEERNVENYMTCFDSAFVFLADPYEANGPNAERYADWTYATEESVTTRLFAAQVTSGSISLQLTDSLRIESDTIATLYEHYQLSVRHPTLMAAQGTARLMMRRFGIWWSIHEWQDIRADTTDWGEVKGQFRGR
jgi:hypothetical protein